MERLTKRLADGTAYTGALINASIKGVTYPTYIGKAADKLAEYEDAEEQGLILRLPCKVGDIVWEVNTERKRISKFLIESITVYPCNVIQFNWTLLEGIYKNVVGFSKAELGTTVFLTREEAEAKLKGVEEKESKDVSAWKNHIINRFMREE